MPGALAIQHDDRLAARLEHPVDLGQRGFRVVRVVRNAVRIDDVEGVVAERQALGIPLNRDATVRGRLQQRKLHRRRAHAVQREIDAGHVGAVERKHRRMGAGARPDFQNGLAGELGKRHLDHGHVAAVTEHVLQGFETLPQTLARRVRVLAPMEGIVERLPELLNVVLWGRLSHGMRGVRMGAQFCSIRPPAQTRRERLR